MRRGAGRSSTATLGGWRTKTPVAWAWLAPMGPKKSAGGLARANQAARILFGLRPKAFAHPRHPCSTCWPLRGAHHPHAQHLTLPDVDVDMGTSCCRCKSGSRASSEANLCSTACVVFSRVDQPTYDFRRASSLEAPCFILQRVFNLIQCVACSMPCLWQTPNRRSFLIPEVVIHIIIDIIGVILPVIPPVSFPVSVYF